MLSFVLFPQADRGNPLSAELYNLFFYSLDVVCRGSDPQRQVGTKFLFLYYSLNQNICQSNNFNVYFSLNCSCFKVK